MQQNRSLWTCAVCEATCETTSEGPAEPRIPALWSIWGLTSATHPDSSGRILVCARCAPVRLTTADKESVSGKFAVNRPGIIGKLLAKILGREPEGPT